MSVGVGVGVIAVGGGLDGVVVGPGEGVGVGAGALLPEKHVDTAKQSRTTITITKDIMTALPQLHSPFCAGSALLVTAGDAGFGAV